MFEMPEYLAMAREMEHTILGKIVERGELGNSIVQDILFLARIHPKRDISRLAEKEVDSLHELIESTVRKAADLGGRNDETGFLGQQGGYKRLMYSGTKECPACGGPVEKLQYLGGSCYVCPECQK